MRVTIIGAGAMGAPTAMALADRGHVVELLDRYGIPNLQGGSGFGLRSFRLSHSDPADVRLALRALELFRDLQTRSGKIVYRRLGILHLGRVVAPMTRALEAENIPIRHLEPAEVARIFPELRQRPDQPAMFQPDGGVNDCVAFLTACVERAVVGGASVSRERAVAIVPRGDGARVFTDRRRIDADRVVVCAGPWTNQVLSSLGLRLPLQPALAQVSYFRGAAGDDDQRPNLMERTRGADEALYGLIGPGLGYKLGFAVVDRRHFFRDLTARPIDVALEQALVRRVREDFPGFDPSPVRTECGVVTLTPDDRFILDRYGPVVIGAGCMGHAFKFAPAIGEFLADLVEERALPLEADRFRLDRPGLSGTIATDAHLAVEA